MTRFITMEMADLNLTPQQEEDGVPENHKEEEDHQEDAAGKYSNNMTVNML